VDQKKKAEVVSEEGPEGEVVVVEEEVLQEELHMEEEVFVEEDVETHHEELHEEDMEVNLILLTILYRYHNQIHNLLNY